MNSLQISHYIEIYLDENIQIPSNYVIQQNFEVSEVKLLFPSSNTCHASPFTIIFKPGTYLIELFGGVGGGNSGGKGGTTSGIITFYHIQKLYFYIGAKGSQNQCVTFGGGGQGGSTSYSGGGATDIRLKKGDDYDALLSRIMVAAGGGGSNSYANNIKAGDGGGLIGGDSEMGPESRIQANKSIGATQTRGGISIQKTPGSAEQGNNGEFGIGASTKQRTSYPGGGGGGYYGGASSNDGFDSVSSGSGGSSFISGLRCCNAVKEDGSHSNTPFHYSGIYFINPETKSGVNGDNGYAIIKILLSNNACKTFSYKINQLGIYLYLIVLFNKK